MLKLALTGKAGWRYRAVISDDLSGVWSVKQAPGLRSFVKMRPGTTFGNRGLSKYYIHLPPASGDLAITVRGIHTGTFAAWLLSPEGELSVIAGDNSSGVRLPWLQYDKSVRPEKTLCIKRAASKQNEIWCIMLSAAGDVGLEITGSAALISVEK